MADSVKFIFKTLIKVPVMIMVFYLVFNLFAFSFTYFRVMGISYVIMQTAVENNYLPESELNTLQNYVDSIANTAMVSEGRILLNDPKSPIADDATVRRQYGSEVAVGVSVNYTFIWPLSQRDQLKNPDEGFIGYGGNESAFSGFADSATLEARRNDDRRAVRNNIEIVYRVPGLKYYPDLQ